MSKTIIKQIIYRVTNNTGIYTLSAYKEVFADVTDYEHVQILEEIDFHLENFNTQRKQFLNDFTDAYIQKHKLFGETSSENTNNNKPLTTEEKQALWRMFAIKDTLSDKTYTKKIN